jgi:hypothetical protein
MSDDSFVDCPNCGASVSFAGVPAGKNALCPECSALVVNPAGGEHERPKPPIWRQIAGLDVDDADKLRLTDFTAHCECGKKLEVTAVDCGKARPCPKCGKSVSLVGECFYCRAPTADVLHIVKCVAKSETVYAFRGQRHGTQKTWIQNPERVDVFVCGNCVKERFRKGWVWFSTWGGLRAAQISLAVSAACFLIGIAVFSWLQSEPGSFSTPATVVLIVAILGLLGLILGLVDLRMTLCDGRNHPSVQEPIAEAYRRRTHPDGTRLARGETPGDYITLERYKETYRYTDDYAF